MVTLGVKLGVIDILGVAEGDNVGVILGVTVVETLGVGLTGAEDGLGLTVGVNEGLNPGVIDKLGVGLGDGNIALI